MAVLITNSCMSSAVVVSFYRCLEAAVLILLFLRASHWDICVKTFYKCLCLFHQPFCETCIFLASLFKTVLLKVKKVKVKWSRYRPGVAQRVGRGIALLFHDRSTRRGWVVSSTPRPHFTPGKDPVPILQESGWAPGLVWTGGKSRPHRDSILDQYWK